MQVSIRSSAFPPFVPVKEVVGMDVAVGNLSVVVHVLVDEVHFQKEPLVV